MKINDNQSTNLEYKAKATSAVVSGAGSARRKPSAENAPPQTWPLPGMSSSLLRSSMMRRLPTFSARSMLSPPGHPM